MIYEFEGYHLDSEKRELWHGEMPVAVEPQVFDVLHCLLLNSQSIVSRDELLSSVWNGRVVSESTISSRIAAARLAVGDSGEGQRLIRTIAKKGFRFVAPVRERDALRESDHSQGGGAQTTDTTGDETERRNKPAIAVLPFVNISGDPEQEYFSDGISEDLVIALSQFRWLFVIASGSSFVFKGKNVDVKQIGRELGVRYILAGSARRSGNRIRITAQLVEARSSTDIWAGRFDGMMEDIFDLQDQVTANVIGAIAPKLEQVEIERAKRKPTKNLDAYDIYMRGIAGTVTYTRVGYAEALRLFRRAIETDPDFAAAYGMAAWCIVTQKVNGWLEASKREVEAGADLARIALRLANDDAVALCWGGFSLGFLANELDDAIAYVERARAHNPNLAPAWYLGGWLYVYKGNHDQAIRYLMHAIELSPLDPLIFRAHAGLAYAHFFLGHHEEAWRWGEIALRERPDWLTAVRIGAAYHALSGRIDEAERLMKHMRDIDPNLRLSNLGDSIPLRRSQDIEKWSASLRAAGLPE